MTDCIFCKIIAGEIPSKKAYEDEEILAFYDITPHAPIHILVVPKQHIESLDAITAETAPIVGKIALVIKKIAGEQGLDKGYRVITNIGEHGAQSVKHLHFHILGGKQLSEKLN